MLEADESGWLPIIDRRCPPGANWKKGDWEWKHANGNVYHGRADIWKIICWAEGAVAIRRISQDKDQNWITHEGGPCPIPWAKAGEFEYFLGGFSKISPHDAIKLLWHDIRRYCLTNGWLPLLNGKCPAAAANWKEGEREWKDSSGNIHVEKIDTRIIYDWHSIIAVRKIQQAKTKEPEQIVEPVLRSPVLTPNNSLTSPPITSGNQKVMDESWFDAQMGSYEAKRKAIRNAKERKSNVPEIGMAVMMRIAGKAMEDK